MKIFIAADHAGFNLKKFLIEELEQRPGYEVIDCGAHKLVEGDDYPEYIGKAAQNVSESIAAFELSVGMEPEEVRGIVIGGSGQGEAIVANRYFHVRAAVFYGGDKKIADEIIQLSREHNDANVLSLGARFISDREALDAVDLWLTTPFSNEEKHARRNAEIEEHPENGLYS